MHAKIHEKLISDLRLQLRSFYLVSFIISFSYLIFSRHWSSYQYFKFLKIRIVSDVFIDICFVIVHNGNPTRRQVVVVY